MRIVFMGTPEFAVPSLAALLDAGYEVVGVFTQPDRPSGRGGKLSACPVKQLAVSRGLRVCQVEKIRRADGLELLRELSPDLCVTAAFGQILSQANLDVPPLGTVNVHASLLPKYRGAAPINWCILMGEDEAGVTTMYTDAGIDTGDMLLAEKTPIGPEETAGELTARLSQMGARLLIRTLQAIEQGTCPRIKQNPDEATHQPMLDKQMGLMDFAQDAQALARKVRGLNPWPGTYAALPEGMLKVWKAHAVEGDFGGVPGQIVVSDGKDGLIVACGAGALQLDEIQAPAAKRMDAKAYLRGKVLPIGMVLNG
ncbi:MAG: methionyl-tRNA formyltransferase [Clostridia bacterium]